MTTGPLDLTTDVPPLPVIPTAQVVDLTADTTSVNSIKREPSRSVSPLSDSEGFLTVTVMDMEWFKHVDGVLQSVSGPESLKLDITRDEPEAFKGHRKNIYIVSHYSSFVFSTSQSS